MLLQLENQTNANQTQTKSFRIIHLSGRAGILLILLRKVSEQFSREEKQAVHPKVFLFSYSPVARDCVVLVYSSGTRGLKERREEGVGLGIFFNFFFNELETPSHGITSEKSASALLCRISCIASGERCYHRRPCIVVVSWRVYR